MRQDLQTQPAYPHFATPAHWTQRREENLRLGTLVCSHCRVLWPCAIYLHDRSLAAADVRSYFRDAPYAHADALVAQP